MIALFAAALVSCLGAPCAIENVRVEVGDGTVLPKATVVVEKGRISEVSQSARVPEGAHRIDGTGKVLTPGLIEARSRLGVTEVLMVEETNDHTHLAANLTPAFRAADGFNHASVWIPVAREGGVTSAVIYPGGGLLRGQGHWIDLTGTPAGGPDPDRPVAQFASVDAGAAMVSGGARGAMWLLLRRVVDDARFLRARRKDYDAGKTRPLVLEPIQLEALWPVLDGTLPLVVRADRASDILQVIDWAKKERIRVIIAGGAEAWQVAGRLAQAKVPVILRPTSQMPGSFDTLGARDDSPARLAAAGVDLVLTAGGWDQNVRRLRQEAGIAVAYGLDRNRALAAITSAPARLFGQGAEVGTVSPGKRANLVLWSGDPFELSTVAERVLIDGVEQSLVTRQRRLVDRYLGLPAPRGE